MNLKKITRFIIDNYFISIFVAIIIFVGFVAAFKLFATQPTYIYAKVKLGQGLWWSGGNRPYMWFVNALKKGDNEVDLLGRPIAEILSVKYYPYYGSDQYDIYLTLKLRVSVNKKTKKYNFKRSALGVASPIQLEFSSVQISGTVIDISEQEFKDKYVDKTIILTKKYAYPWEYDSIRPGDKYFDGENDVFEILEKYQSLTNQVVSTEKIIGLYTFVPITTSFPEARYYIVVKAKVKVKEINKELFLGEDQKINVGKTINISTPNFTFNDFSIAGIE